MWLKGLARIAFRSTASPNACFTFFRMVLTLLLLLRDFPRNARNALASAVVTVRSGWVSAKCLKNHFRAWSMLRRVLALQSDLLAANASKKDFRFSFWRG